MMAIERRNDSSVIAKLMGFDDVSCQQQPVYRQQRVLSDNYLRKSASLGSHGTRLSKIRQKSRTINKVNSTSQASEIEERKLGNVKQAAKRMTFGWEFKKQLLERSKRTKVCQENWFSKRVCNLGEAPSKLDAELKKRSKKLGTEVVLRSNEGWKDKSVTKLPIFKRSSLSSSSSTKYKRMLKGDLKSSSGRHNIVSTDSKDVDFSCSLDDSFEQDSLCEDRFTSLNGINMDNELTRSTGEGYQPSPNSVLEPDNSSGSECGENVSTDLHGLWVKLENLKSEMEENLSKGDMATLSHEDATERYFSIGQNIKPARRFGQENQQFSYLVNVLNELGFHGGNMKVSLERCIMNPVIFETLEKKYGTQKSWNKTDRKLLFDHIIVGLTEMFFSNPLKRKISGCISRDVIAEELWDMLLSRQNQVNADLSEKAIGKEPWLELEDEVDCMVEEIEAILFEELATELVVI